MLKPLFANPRARLLLVLTLVVCLSWLALWCFHQPVSHGSGASGNDPVQATRPQKEWQQGSRGQAGVPSQMAGAVAREYLKQSRDGQSLAAAVNEARYSINRATGPALVPGTDTYEAFNPAHDLQLRFTSEGAQVSSDTGQRWQLGLRLKGYGYHRTLEHLVSGQLEATGNRIEINKHSHKTTNALPLVEWYVNKPDGLEQGFTVNAPPEKDSQQESACGPLRLVLELSGDLQGELSGDGQSLSLKDRHGLRLSTYDHLKAFDATGHELAARMRLLGREISLEVDDAGAHYPLTLDPTLSLWQQQYKLTSTSTGAFDLFGRDVAISGNTAIVGASREGGTVAGAAYVFVRSGSQWALQQRLGAEAFGRFPEVFGFSVAIMGDTAVVGAIFTTFDNDHGGVNQEQGAAFVYVRSGNSWLPQQMLSASDGKADDRFGYSVAISGETILVGAFGGAAYVFTRNNGTWSQQQKLTGDQQAGSLFAYSVALSGETALILGGVDNGEAFLTGKAYFFDRSNGVWTEKQALLANDHVPGDSWTSVAISGDTAFVGYYNGGSGAIPPDLTRQGAYVFERSGGTWSQRQRLIVSSPLTTTNYIDLAIDHDTAILGLPSDDPDLSGRGRGSAYLFVRAGPGWVEQKKLAASDATPGDSFGFSVGISGDSAIVGAANASVDGHIGQGSAYIFLRSPDTDGDGLPDDWETNGVTIDGEFIDLKAMGADPMHKDIFVHADWMGPDPGRPGVVIKPERRAIKIVVDAFSIAPVENPDHQPGINLHVDLGPTSVLNYVTGATTTWGSLSRASEVPFQTTLGSNNAGGDYNWSAVDAIKALHFTPAKRRAVFHYALFANNFSPASNGGLSRGYGAADFIVTLGDWNDPGGTLMEQAGTFMHELGHNLGLHHGGDDDINTKPNYLSIMNYSFTNIGIFQPLGRQRIFDYSREVLPSLDERNLDEFKGISDPGLHLTLWNRRTREDVPAGSNACFANAKYFNLFFPTDALDWNCDGLQTATPVSADINGDGDCVSPGANGVIDSIPAGDDPKIRGYITAGVNRTCETAAVGDDAQVNSPGFVQPDLLRGFKDWLAIKFDGGGSIGALGAGPPYPQSIHNDEPTLAKILDVAPDGAHAEELAAPLDVVTVSPTAGPAPLLVSFDGTGSTAVNATIVSWSWNFGDGSTGTGATVTHTYTAVGTYFASLTVEDNNGHVNLVPLLNRVVVVDVPSPTPTPTPSPSPSPSPTASPTPEPTPTPPTGDYHSRKSGDWSDPCTWNPPNSSGSCGTGVPGGANNVEILHSVTISTISSAESLKVSGSMSGPGLVMLSGDAQILGGVVNTALTVAGNTSVIGGGELNNTLRTKNVTVDGALGGTGVILVSGSATSPTTFANNGSVSLAGVAFGNTGEAFKYVISGGGAWNIGQGVQLVANNTLELTGNVPMNAGFLSIPAGSTLLINAALVFGGGQIANTGIITIGGSLDFNGTTINNAGLFDIGNSTLNFNGTEEFGSGIGGTVLGAGKIRFAPGDGGAILVLNGVLEPGVTIASGTVEYRSGQSSTNTGGVAGPFIVDAGATFAMTASAFYMHNDVTINGAVTKAVGLPGDTALLFFNGSTFTNNGAIGNIDFFTFNISDTPRSQVVAGTGSWDAKNIDVGGTSPTSTVTLLNDITFAANQLQIGRGATFDIGNHTLTLNGATHVVGSTGGRVAGTGLVKMQPGTGTATIGSIFTGTTIDPSLEITAGTVKLSGVVLGGKLAIDQGGTLSLFGSLGLKAAGDVTVDGTLNAFSDAPLFYFKGNTFTNNGIITGQVPLLFGDSDRQYIQMLAGSGSWTGTPFLYIDPNSTTTLLTDVTYGGSNMFVDGRLNTGGFTLTLPCNVPWSGSGDAVGNVHRTNLANCSGAAIAYGNPFTTIQFTSGASPTEVTVKIALTAPPGFLNAVKRTYIVTPADAGGYSATLRLHYLDSDLNGNTESNLQLWRSNGSSWSSQGTTSRNTTQNWVERAGVTQFSPWTISGPSAPTAAPAMISGRIVTADSTALGGVLVTLNGSRTQRTMTNSLGQYKFENVETDGFYTVTPSLTNYGFSPRALSFSLLADKTDAVFTAVPTAAIANPLDGPEFFVRQQYLDFLDREPDRGGFEYWSDQINSCDGDPSCIHNRRIGIANAFFFQLEYQQTGAYVFRLYRAAFGDNQPFPNPGNSNQAELNKLPGYEVFVRDRALVIGGSNLAQNQLDLANAFVGRAQFLAKYPASQDGPNFVDAITATIRNDTGADLTPQRTALVDLFNSGGRGAVLYRLADDNLQTNPINNRAFIDAEYNRAFVTTQYFGYLRRDPDIEGFLFWLGQVNAAPLKDVTRQHAMVCAFITAAEYQQRFSSVVTHSNAECQ